MTAHRTPEPWMASVEEKPVKGHHWYVVLDEHENAIGEFYGSDHAENVANLHLAAAAPELLSTLIALEKWFDTDPEILDALPEAERADNARQLAKIRAAIAKAIGGAA